MAAKIFNPFLLLLARFTSKELVETVQSSARRIGFCAPSFREWYR